MATTTSQVRIGVATQEYKRPPRSLWADAWFTFTRDKLAMAGLAMLALLVLATLIGPFFYERPVGVIDFEKALLGPSLEHPFGTDDLGRDLLGRSLWGGGSDRGEGRGRVRFLQRRFRRDPGPIGRGSRMAHGPDHGRATRVQ